MIEGAQTLLSSILFSSFNLELGGRGEDQDTAQIWLIVVPRDSTWDLRTLNMKVTCIKIMLFSHPLKYQIFD